MVSDMNISETIAHAVNYRLAPYRGKEPRWLSKDRAEAKSLKEYKSDVELLDVLDTPAGPAAVTWTPMSTEKRDIYPTLDKGIAASLLKVQLFDTGESISRLTLGFANDYTFRLALGDDDYTPLRYVHAYDGRGSEIPLKPTQAEILKAWHGFMRSGIVKAYQDNGMIYPSYSTPSSYVPADAAAELKAAAAAFRPSMKETLETYQSPYVDFARTEDKYRGVGYGQIAYLYAAKRLAKDRKLLLASSSQTDYAKAAWRRLNKTVPNNVTSAKFGNRTVSALKFF